MTFADAWTGAVVRRTRLGDTGVSLTAADVSFVMAAPDVPGLYTTALSRADVNGQDGLVLAGGPYLNVTLSGPPPPSGTDITQYYDVDAVGSVRRITQVGTSAVIRKDYQPFGAAYGSTPASPIGDRVQFAGKERDPESGLDYFGARYFSAFAGRYTTVDPLHVDAALVDPQRWNRYGFVRNNPLRFSDPTGLYIASCDEGVKKCDDEIQRFDKTLQQMLQSKDEAVRSAASAYGQLGVDNGVNLSIVNRVDPKFSDVTGLVTAQEGTGGMRLIGNAMAQATQVLIKAGLRGSDLASTLIHEGVHVKDRASFISSVNVATNTWSQSLNITGRQSEINAYSAENLYWARIGGPQRNILSILSKPPYSVNTNIERPLFPLLVR